MSPLLDELFLAACGVVERSFAAPFALIGSQADNCLRLDDPNVSRRHAYFQVLPGGVFCVDLGSRLGLRWDETERYSGWLFPDRPLQFGSFKVELIPNNRAGWIAGPSWAPENPLADRAIETNPLPAVVGTISLGDQTLAEWRMNRVLGLVGRSPKCLVFVEHKSLSRFHCSLVRTPLGLWVVDLLSTKGTILNGKRVRCSRIHEGDVVQAGKYTLRFWYQQPQPKAVAQIGYKKTEENPADTKPVPGTSLEPARRTVATHSTFNPDRRLTQLAGAPGQANPEGSLLVTLANQFSQMQQQMFDQFQESLLMATRLFASLHQEQMTIVRRELDQLHNLTAELQSLQKQLNEPRTKAEPAPSPAEVDSVLPILKGPAAPPSGETVHAAPTVTSPSEMATPGEGASAPAANEDIHAWLTQRISSLQEERQTRWNKLLGMILGT
jgi:pSer/pThr/pTyr-binding forkhead associated (FHA) protein